MHCLSWGTWAFLAVLVSLGLISMCYEKLNTTIGMLCSAFWVPEYMQVVSGS